MGTLLGRTTFARAVRRSQIEDPNCRLVPGDPEEIYSTLCLRIYPVDNNLAVQTVYGKEAKDIIGASSQFASRLRPCDSILIPWGATTNLAAPLDLPCGFYPKVDILTPYGPGSLTWSSGAYSGDGYTLLWNGDNWALITDEWELDFDVAISQFMDITVQEWPTGYSVTDRYGPEKEYRIERVWHHSDECGRYHHTQMWLKETCYGHGEDWRTGLND